jgi:starch-binding outer membrane protein, SusD/RagB family
MRHTLKNGRAVVVTVAILASAGALASCDSLKTTLLEAKDPDIIDPSAVQSPAGASAVRAGALSRFRLMTTGSGNAGTEGTWLIGGLLADEWSTSSTFVQNDEADERQISPANSSVDGSLRAIYRVPTAANQAIALLNKWKPSPSADIAEMYFIRGFAQMQLAQDFCNGIPLSDAAGDNVVLGTPLPINDVFTISLASYDSAIDLSSLALAKTKADSTAADIINRAAKIGKARALLGLGRPAEAAALVTGIPTSFTYDVTSSLTSGSNGVWNQGASQRRYNVGDSLEGNAHNLLVKNVIPFSSLKDPRLPVSYTINGKDTTKSQDGATFSRTTPLYGQTSNMAAVNGIDARLVEAEAALAAGNPAGMISILNTLRATTIVLVPPSAQASGTHPGLTYTANALPPLTDPGSADARINLLFREKALWTFTRGQRLGDMRRLIRQYHRTPDQVFPVGQHYRGATYGADVNLPITTGESNGNPNFTGCLDRNA